MADERKEEKTSTVTLRMPSGMVNPSRIAGTTENVAFSLVEIPTAAKLTPEVCQEFARIIVDEVKKQTACIGVLTPRLEYMSDLREKIIGEGIKVGISGDAHDIDIKVLIFVPESEIAVPLSTMVWHETHFRIPDSKNIYETYRISQ